jgi:hypothetical protein
MGFDPSQPRDKEGKWARVKGALRRFATVETAVKLGTLAAGVAIAHSLKNQHEARTAAMKAAINAQQRRTPTGPKINTSLSDLRRASNRATQNFATAVKVAPARSSDPVGSLLMDIDAFKKERSDHAKHAASMKRSTKASVASAKGRIK